MAYREVPGFEVREVLRLWLDGRGYRAIAGLVPPHRKTVTRVIEAAAGLGLDRDGDDSQLSDEFVGKVIGAVRPPTRLCQGPCYSRRLRAESAPWRAGIEWS